MNVHYSDNVKNSEDYGLLQTLSDLPSKVVPQTERVRAEWDRKTDPRGKSLYSLRLADASEEAQSAFPIEELRDPLIMHFRLHHLWGDVLQARSHRLLRQLQSDNGSGA
jgi:hypothetical protein